MLIKKNRKVSLAIHSKYKYFDSTVQRQPNRLAYKILAGKKQKKPVEAQRKWIAADCRQNRDPRKHWLGHSLPIISPVHKDLKTICLPGPLTAGHFGYLRLWPAVWSPKNCENVAKLGEFVHYKSKITFRIALYTLNTGFDEAFCGNSGNNFDHDCRAFSLLETVTGSRIKTIHDCDFMVCSS